MSRLPSWRPLRSHSCSSSPEIATPANITVDKTPERIERGKYLYTTLADCDSCHAEHDYTRLYSPLASPARGTGAVLPFQDLTGQGLPGQGLPGRMVASNLTPDKDTGIGAWDYARFRDRLQTFRKEYSSTEKLPKIGPDRFTVMHYIAYSGLTEADWPRCSPIFRRAPQSCGR
jgi:hypothetical protein